MERLGHIICDSSKLRQLIAERPELPLVFLVDSDVVADIDYNSWYCSDIRCYIGEILDCDFSKEKIYTDRQEFEEDLETLICDNWNDYCPDKHACGSRCYECYCDIPDQQFEDVLQKELDKYKRYWTDCIIIHGTN